MKVEIDSGKISITPTYTHDAYSGVDELIGFANRRNENRGFLFVSKILGKHIPVTPSEMRKVYDSLSTELSSDSKAFVVGLAETATGLGAGVASALENKQVYFQHTTRTLLPGVESWFDVSESHSHAVSHIIYKPNETVMSELSQVENLILVDDEITTGNTLKQLAKGYLEVLPNIKKINIVSILSWLDVTKFDEFKRDVLSFCEDKGLAAPELVQNFLFNGSFDFEPNEDYKQQLPELTHKGASVIECSWNMGRLPVQMKHVVTSEYLIKIKELAVSNPDQRISIIGTGENMYLPYLIASQLELDGYNVTVQSTTRSPVVVDDDVIKNCTVIPMYDNGNVEHYIYNLDDSKLNIVITETGSQLEKEVYKHLGYVM